MEKCHCNHHSKVHASTRTPSIPPRKISFFFFSPGRTSLWGWIGGRKNPVKPSATDSQTHFQQLKDVRASIMEMFGALSHQSVMFPFICGFVSARAGHQTLCSQKRTQNYRQTLLGLIPLFPHMHIKPLPSCCWNCCSFCSTCKDQNYHIKDTFK